MKCLIRLILLGLVMLAKLKNLANIGKDKYYPFLYAFPSQLMAHFIQNCILPYSLFFFLVNICSKLRCFFMKSDYMHYIKSCIKEYLLSFWKWILKKNVRCD